jgi:hypothetical protein
LDQEDLGTGGGELRCLRKFPLQEATMKLNILTVALAATAFGALAANAQSVIIEDRREPPTAVVVDPAPPSSVRIEERGGFLGTEKKTTTETTGTGLNGDCSTRTVHKEGIGEDKTVSRTNCQ